MCSLQYVHGKEDQGIGDVLINVMPDTQSNGYPSTECRRAVLYFLKKAQKELSLKSARMLFKMCADRRRHTRNHWLESKEPDPKFSRTPYLAVLNHSHSLCKMYTERAHRGGS
jgi:hypothetical protein